MKAIPGRSKTYLATFRLVKSHVLSGTVPHLLTSCLIPGTRSKVTYLILAVGPWGQCTLLGKATTCIRIRGCSAWKPESTCTGVWSHVRRRLGGRDSLPMLLVQLTCEISHVGLEKTESHRSSSTFLTSFFLKQGVLEEGVNISDLVAPRLSLVRVCSETDGLQVKKEAVISKFHPPLPSGLLRL